MFDDSYTFQLEVLDIWEVFMKEGKSSHGRADECHFVLGSSTHLTTTIFVYSIQNLL